MKLRLPVFALCFGIHFISTALAYNIEQRENALSFVKFNSTIQAMQSSPMYAGYTFVANSDGEILKIVAGAPKFSGEDSQSLDTNGALLECFLQINKNSTSATGENKFSTNTSCQIVVDDKSLPIGHNHLRSTDSLGMTLVKRNNADNQYTSCAFRRQKRCGASNVYIPGSCYSGPANNNMSLLNGWNEIPCFFTYLDVIFLIDSSDSIAQNDFEIMKEVLINVSVAFTDSIGDTTQIGILQYGDQVITLDGSIPDLTSTRYYKTPTKLGDCHDVACLQKSIKENMNHLRTSNTFTALALRRAVQVDFAASRNKDVATKILVVITDGIATDKRILQDSYDITSQNNITVYAIGVGKHVKTTQLKTIANGGTSSERVLTTTNFRQLQEQLIALTSAISQVSAEGSGKVGLTLENAQLGMSAHYSQGGKLYLGAVGANYWSGTVVKYDFANDSTADVSTFEQISSVLSNNSADSYLGYSLTSGFFNGGSTEYVAVGAPKHRYCGTVVVYEPIVGSTSLLNPQTIRGYHCENCAQMYEHLGSYFGGSLLSGDFNGDGKDDLLIGAPLHSSGGYDEGRVYVYISKPVRSIEQWASDSFEPTILIGGRERGGRFGTTMSTAGDLNNDGYNDVVIAAPYADSKKGIIYVYHGSSIGIDVNAKQVIRAADIMGHTLQYFGFSVAGDIDVDGNSYPDLLIGAPKTDSIVVFRTRPVAKLDGTLNFNSNFVDVLECFRRPDKSCIELITCFTVRGKSVEKIVEIQFNLKMNTNQKRVEFREQANSTLSGTNVLSKKLTLTRDVENCERHTLYLKEQAVINFISNITVDLTYKLSNEHIARPLSSLTAPDDEMLTSKSIVLLLNCGIDGICKYDLSLKGEIYLPPSTNIKLIQTKDNGSSFDSTNGGRTLIISADTANKPIIVKANLTNYGEHAHGARVTVTYPKILTWGNVAKSMSSATTTGCVYDNQAGPSDASSKSRNLLFRLDHFPENIFPQGEWCYFEYKLSFGNLKSKGNQESLQLTMTANTTNSDLSHDLNTTDNSFARTVPIKYRADVVVIRKSVEIVVVPFNFTDSNTMIHSVKQVGLNTSDISITYEVAGLGFSNIPNSTVSLKYAAFLTPLQPLLYLYKVDCTSTQGNAKCTCDQTNINKYNLSLNMISHNNQTGNSILPTVNVEALNTTLFNCSDQNHSVSFKCESLLCNIANLGLQDNIEITAIFRLWTSTLRLSNQSEVKFQSTFTYSTENSLLITDKYGRTPLEISSHVFTTAKEFKVVLIHTQPSQWWIYVAAGVGGLLVLFVVVFILHKTGFFKSKYYNPQKTQIRNGIIIDPKQNEKSEQSNQDITSEANKVYQAHDEIED